MRPKLVLYAVVELLRGRLLRPRLLPDGRKAIRIHVVKSEVVKATVDDVVDVNNRVKLHTTHSTIMQGYMAYAGQRTSITATRFPTNAGRRTCIIGDLTTQCYRAANYG